MIRTSVKEIFLQKLYIIGTYNGCTIYSIITIKSINKYRLIRKNICALIDINGFTLEFVTLRYIIVNGYTYTN